MTLEEFTIQTKTLTEFYGKEFNFTQTQIWFDELKAYSAEKYERAIRQLCKKNQYRPTLSEMLETIRTLKSDKQAINVPCKICKGTGYILYHKKINNDDYEYACLCTCENSKDKAYDGRTIADKDHRSNYYIKIAQEVFAKEG